jgi:hypothetical protein
MAMTYAEALDALRGHLGWWYYDLHGSEDREPDEAVRQRVRAEAIELAKTFTARPDGVPSLLQQAKNAMAAAGRVVTALATGEQVRVSPEDRDKRLATCSACPELIDGKCRLCGCYFKAKIELATERCPIDKWETVQ